METTNLQPKMKVQRSGNNYGKIEAANFLQKHELKNLKNYCQMKGFQIGGRGNKENLARDLEA
eukprot:gene3155-5471_t